MQPNAAPSRFHRYSAFVMGAGAILVLGCAAHRQSLPLETFNHQVKEYLEMRSQVVARVGGLKAQSSAGRLAADADELVEQIQLLRRESVEGLFFPPQVAAILRRSVAARLSQPDGPQILAAIQEVQPPAFDLLINSRYPDTLPRPTMPPSILDVLPPIPPLLEYRIVGHDLILLDRNTAIVLDVVRDLLEA